MSASAIAKYGGGLGIPAASPLHAHVEVHGHDRAAGEGRERGVETAIVEDGGVDAAGELPQLGDRRLRRRVRLGDERLRGIGVGVDLLLREAERHADRDQPRLHAVVQVALDARALDIGGADGTGALRAGRARDLGELGLPRRHHDSARDDHTVQDAAADDRDAAATTD